MSAWPLESLVGLAERNWEGMLQNWVPGTFLPDERDELMDYFKRARHQADWVTSAKAFSVSEIGDVLPRVQTPTLVLHARDFIWLPAEESMKTAAAIKGARFALLDGVLPMGDPTQGIPIIQNFLAGLIDDTPPEASGQDSLSSREVEVLRLVAAGWSNQQIADELVISLNTIRRHVSNVFDKTGVANRAQATAYAKDHGIA
jgi:DNA-binding CsgD family transcriptional regulator